MKVLVTGSNGFVGSHIVEALHAVGHEVVCLCRETSDLRWIMDLGVERRCCDIRQGDRLPEVLKDIDVVVHAAGILRALTSALYYEVNQHSTRRLAEAAAASGVKKFVYISSQAAMGPSGSLMPKRLDEAENPVSDYGKSKLMGERELKALSGSLPCTILRPASVYGPRDKDIFIFFNLVHRGLRPMPLRKRYLQLLYVGDLAAAVIKAITSITSDNKTYFLADEKPYSWEEIGTTIAAALGKKTLPLPLPDAAFHVTSAIAESIGRLKKVPAVINRQKVAEMLQPYWLGDNEPARAGLGMDFTKLNLGATITYLWYTKNDWL